MLIVQLILSDQLSDCEDLLEYITSEKDIKRILIVDNELTILLTLSHILKKDEVRVMISKKIETAEEALKRHFFDLVITDISMLGMHGIEGLELCSYIKDKSPKTEVIIMSAYGSDEIRNESYKRGAYFYFEKPINIYHLLNKCKGLGIPV